MKTKHTIPCNFSIPKRFQKKVYRLQIDDTLFVIQPESRRSVSFHQNGPNPKGRKRTNWTLDWIQESIEHLRAMCSNPT